MADEYDGSVRIDSRMNTDSVRIGAEQITRAINQLQQSIERSSQSMFSSLTSMFEQLNGNIGTIVTTTGEIANTLQTVTSGTSRTADEAARLSRELTTASDRYRDIANEQERAQQAGAGITHAGGTGVPGSTNNPPPVTSPATDTDTVIHDIESEGRAIEGLTDKITRYEQALEGKDRSSDEFAALEKEIKKTENALNSLVEKRQLMQYLGITTDAQMKKYQVLGETIDYVRKQLTQLQELRSDIPLPTPEHIIQSSQALNLLSQRVSHFREVMEGKDSSSDEFKELETEIKRVEREIEKLTSQQRAMENASNFNVQEYQRVSETLVEMRDQYHELRELRDEALNAPKAPEGWEKAVSLSGMLRNALSKLGEVGRNAIYSIQHPVQALDRALGATIQGGIALLGTLAKKALHAAASLAKIAGNAALTYLSKLASAAKNAVIQLMKLAGNAIATGIRKIGSAAKSAAIAMLGLNKNTRKSNNSLKQAIRFLVRYGLGMRSVFALVNKLRRAIVDAFGNLAKQVPEVNKIISDMASSLDLLKNSVATAFQPLLTVVGPILVTFMDNVSAAMEKMGEFFAVLTGQGYIYKATKAQIDYAASLDKTKKKAKEAENQLAGFDHLNILKDNKSDDKEETPTAQFTKTPVDATNTFAQKLKDAFNSGQFRTLGKVLGEKVNQIFTDIDKFIKWDRVKEPVTRFVSGITDTINGLVDGIEWGNIGQTIGDGINTVTRSLNLFFSKINWVNIGKLLADGLNRLFDTVDWADLGTFFANRINATLGVLYGLVENFKWGEAGERFGTAVLALIDGVDWEKLKTIIVDSINGVVLALKNFIGSFDWGSYGTQFADSVNDIIHSVDWAALGSLFGQAIADALAFLTNAVSEFDWGEAGLAFGTAVQALADEIDVGVLAQLLLDAINGAITWMQEFVGSFQWGAEGQEFHDAVLLLADQFPATELGTTLSNLLTNALTFMNNAFGDPNLFLTIGAKLADFLNSVFGNQQLWIQVGDTFNNAVKGLLSFGQGFLDKFEPETAASNLLTALGRIEWDTIASQAWELIKTAFNKAGSFLEALFQDVGNEDDSLPVKIGKKLGEILASVPWGQILQAAADTFMGILQGVFDGLFGSEGNDGKIFAAIVAGVGIIKLGLPALISGVGSVAVKAIGGLSGVLVNAVSSLGTYLSTAISSLAGVVSPAVSGVTAAVVGIYDVVELTKAANTYNDAFEAHKNETATMLSLYEQLYNEKGKAIADEWASTVMQIDTTSMGLDEAQKAIADKVDSYWDDVPQDMWSGFSQGWNHYFGNSSSNGGQGGGLGGLMVDAFDHAVGSVLSFLGINSPSKVFEQIGVDTLAGYENGVNSESPKMDSTVSAAFSRVVDITDTKWSEAANKQSSALNSMDSDMSSAMGTMTSTATQGADNQSAPLYEKWGEAEYLTQICLEDIKNDVTRYMGMTENESSSGMYVIQNAIQNGMNNISNVARSGFEDIFNAARNIYWDTIGYEITNGIYRGVTNNWNWLYNTVWNLAYDLFYAAKRALGIYSPSHVFRDGIGENIGLGIAEGITNTEPDIIDTVSDLADIANETMNDAGINGQFEADGTGIVEGLDGVLNVFSEKVQSSFTDMLTKLSAIAENVSFRTPNFATGTVLPYSIVSGADSGDMSDISDTISASNEELISVIIQTINNQTTALVRAIEQNSYTDSERKTNVDSVIDEINRRTRAMGKSPLLI